MIGIVTEYSAWWLGLIAFVAIGASLVLYYKSDDFETAPAWGKRLLATLRGLVVFVIGVLILSVFFRQTISTLIKPTVVFAQDNSESMLMAADSGFFRAQYQAKVDSIRSILAEDYEVHTLTFGDRVREQDSFNFREKYSDYDMLLDYVAGKFTQTNFGALILAGDGIYTRGLNPLFHAETYGMPVYTVLTGDSVRKNDIRINEVSHPAKGYLHSEMAAEVLIEAFGLAGSQTQLTVSHGKDTIERRQIDVKGNRFFLKIKVNLKLEEEGTQFFTFRLRDTKGESDLANNSQTIAVQVINSTDYILIVSRQTHPDIGALKAAIETNAVLKADVRSELSDTIRLSRYKLVVFYGPDMKLVSDAKLATLSKIGMPLFVVVTSEESAKWVNNKLKMLEFQNLSGLTEATPEPKASFKAFVHTDFDAFFTALPPISVPFAEYVPAKSAEVYLTQQIKDVSTEKPMVLFSKQNQPTGVMVGSGFWRWRLYDFLQNKTQEHFDTWINKMLLYVMQQRNTERFRINIPALSDEGIPVSADAELYNESMERINNVPISIAISDSAKLLFEYQMIPNGDAYHAELGSFSGGSYSYVATTQIGDEKLTRNGKFSVLPLRQESVRSYNDPILMRQLAQLTQGQSITLKQLDQLPELLKQNVNIRPQIKEQNELTDLVHSKILFFLLVILLTAEWGLRKYFGSY